MSLLLAASKPAAGPKLVPINIAESSFPGKLVMYYGKPSSTPI